MADLPVSAIPHCLSIIVPTYNEEDSVALLYEQVSAAMDEIGCAYEMIFVDDGSRDGTPQALKALSDQNAHIRVIEFRRNFGKAAALDAGFQAASGDVIFTMDADLQDDPAEIKRFLAKLDEGFDVVSGWKHVRHDPIDKTLPSKVFNRVVSRLSGVKLNDFNCGFKAYRRDAVRDLTLYGELHRFIPVLLHWDGFKVGEIPVNHRSRQFGTSKYGMGRLFKGALDFLGVMLNTRYATRPLHIFGGVGMMFGAIGMAALLYLSAIWMLGIGPIGNRPLLFFGMLMVMTGFQFITIGLLGEFIQRQSAQPKRRFTIRALRNLENNSTTTDELISELKRAAARLRAGQSTWQPQPSGLTPQSDTLANTTTPTQSTG